MSITFTAEMSAITGSMVTCNCSDDVAGPVFGTYDEALAYLAPLAEDESLRTALPGCVDPEICLQYSLVITACEADPAPSVNVTNLNASDLFRALGILADDPAGEAAAHISFEEMTFDGVPEGDPADSPFNGGSMAPEDFLGRVLLALAITPADEGRPEIDATRPGGAVTVLCARRPGYLQMRLAELHELAQFAVSRNRMIFWS